MTTTCCSFHPARPATQRMDDTNRPVCDECVARLASSTDRTATAIR